MAPAGLRMSRPATAGGWSSTMPPPARCTQQIAKLLGVSLNTLKKHYAEELELGLARANAVVSGTLFAEAKKGNITACIFWLKTRAGWRETAKVEHSGGTSLEVRQVDATEALRRDPRPS